MTDGPHANVLEKRIDDLEDQVSKLNDALLQSQLDDWKARIDQLEVQVHLGQMQARQQLTPLVEQLRNRWLDAREQLDRAQSAAGDALTSLRAGVRSAVKDLGDAFDEAVRRLSQE
jgi:predicted  nucleic acid-binding Zn-ribbon protein